MSSVNWIYDLFIILSGSIPVCRGLGSEAEGFCFNPTPTNPIGQKTSTPSERYQGTNEQSPNPQSSEGPATNRQLIQGALPLPV